MERLIRLKKQRYFVCDLDMFVLAQFLKESQAVLSLGKLCEGSGYAYERHPGQPLNGRQIGCKNRQPHSLGGPRRASNRTPDQSSGRPEAATSCPRPRATCGIRIGKRLQLFTEGLTGRSSSSMEVFPADVAILPPAIPPSSHPPATLTSNEEGGKHTLQTHCPKDLNCEVSRRTKGTRLPCKRNPDGRTESVLPKEFEMWSQQTTRFLMKSTNLDCITNMQWLCRTWQCHGFKVIHAETNQLRRRREVLDNSYVHKKAQHPYTDNCLEFVKVCEELNWNHERSTPAKFFRKEEARDPDPDDEVRQDFWRFVGN